MLFFWVYPDLVIIGRLDQWWLFPQEHEELSRRVIAICDFITATLGFWALMGWHIVVAYCMVR